MVPPPALPQRVSLAVREGPLSPSNGRFLSSPREPAARKRSNRPLAVRPAKVFPAAKALKLSMSYRRRVVVGAPFGNNFSADFIIQARSARTGASTSSAQKIAVLRDGRRKRFAGPSSRLYRLFCRRTSPIASPLVRSGSESWIMCANDIDFPRPRALLRRIARASRHSARRQRQKHDNADKSRA